MSTLYLWKVIDTLIRDTLSIERRNDRFRALSGYKKERNENSNIKQWRGNAK